MRRIHKCQEFTKRIQKIPSYSKFILNCFQSENGVVFIIAIIVSRTSNWNILHSSLISNWKPLTVIEFLLHLFRLFSVLYFQLTSVVNEIESVFYSLRINTFYQIIWSRLILLIRIIFLDYINATATNVKPDIIWKNIN